MHTSTVFTAPCTASQCTKNVRHCDDCRHLGYRVLAMPASNLSDGGVYLDPPPKKRAPSALPMLFQKMVLAMGKTDNDGA